MTISRRKRTRRGSALLLTYFTAMVLGFMVVYGYQSSMTSGTASRAVANSEQADYAAEYAANLAVSELPNVYRQGETISGKILADWVNYENAKDNKAFTDTRTIGGAFEGYDFRVQVRSVREAYANGSAEKNWLGDKYASAFTYGSTNDARFSDTYEVLASARRGDFDDKAAVNRHVGSVYGVVEMAFGDNPGADAERFTTLNFDNGQLKSTGVAVDGQDHYLETKFPSLTVSSGKEIIGAQRGVIADGKFVAATGGYWRAGTLTLNFLNDSRPVDPDSIRSATKNRQAYTPVRPNPHVPKTRGLNDNYVNSNPGHDDRQMTSKFYLAGGNPAEFYKQDYYTKKANAGRPKDEDLLTKDTMPLDLYFLGGKGINNTGRTVNFQDPDLYDKGYDAANTLLYLGAPTGKNKYTGVIRESKASQLEASKPLDVIVGSYEDLKRFYITYIPGTNISTWRTTFVGEWTDYYRKPAGNSAPVKMLFDSNAGVGRRRTFSKHYPMNKEGKILVHEMRMLKNKEMGDPRYASDFTTVWTGRYRWADPDFSGKFWVKEKGAKIAVNIYPREFTWEEITGMKTKRLPSGDDSGMQVAGATYERERGSDPSKAPKVLKNNVWIEGYPICDTLGREVPELDEDNNPIPIGFTEYCSVDADNPQDLIPVVFDNDFVIDKFGVPNAVKRTGKQTALNAYKNKNRQFARRNYIEVVEDEKDENGNNIINYYYDMSDFEFMNVVTIKDQDGVEFESERLMSSIIVGIEDLDEAGSDYDYTDMMFILNVVPPSTDPNTVIGKSSESSRYIQWWDLEHDQGLTGNRSQPPLSSSELPSTSMMDETERYLNNYRYLLNGGDENVTVDTRTFIVKGAEDELAVKYHRAVFKPDGSLDVPDFGEGPREVYYFMAPLSEAAEDEDKPHPDRYDDLFGYMNILAGIDPELLKVYDEDGLLQETDNAERKLIALEAMEEACRKAPGGSVALREIRSRIGRVGDLRTDVVNKDPVTEKETADRNLYRVREERFTSRRQASLVFGGDGVLVPVVQTDEERKPEDDSDAAVVKEQLLFLGGERSPDMADGETVDYTDAAMIQPEGNLIQKEGYFDVEAGGMVTLPAGSTLLPGMILNIAVDKNADENDVADASEKIMEKVYTPLVSSGTAQAILDGFSPDDFRYQLGWHRSGAKLETAGDAVLLDCYRAVMLSVKGIQPYALAETSGTTDEDVIAKVKTLVGTRDGQPIYQYMVNLDTDGKLPTFTFTGKDGAGIDGAGVLVINGNLHVKTTFAYYGQLIVLGDLIIEPTEDEYYHKDAASTFLSANNEKIYRGEGGWFRMVTKTNKEDNLTWAEENYLDDDGNKLEPIKTRQYKGELIVQGQLLVGGDVKTIAPFNSDGSPVEGYDYSKGMLTVLASETARQMIEDTLRSGNGAEIGRFYVNKAVWNTNAKNNVGPLWSAGSEESE